MILHTLIGAAVPRITVLYPGRLSKKWRYGIRRMEQKEQSAVQGRLGTKAYVDGILLLKGACSNEAASSKPGYLA